MNLKKAGTIIFIILLMRGNALFSIPRSKVLKNAKAFAEHKWTCKPENTVVDCSDNWESDYTVGEYVGLPYDWGGYKTIAQFDEDLKNGLGAGSHSWHGVLECTTGLDCSGFVSQCFETSHHTTSSMYEITEKIDASQILPGDIFNKPKYHVVLWVSESENGNPIFYEASGSASKVWLNESQTWSYLNQYIPRRYKKIVNDSEILSEGTLKNPIEIKKFPFTDKNNTDFSNEYNINYYSCDPDNLEGGPEIYYELYAPKKLNFLTIEVEDEFFTDIDIHLLKDAPLPQNCLYRHDKKISVKDLEPGIYYIVADTWEGDKGHPFSGEYLLTVDGEFEDGSKIVYEGTETSEKTYEKIEFESIMESDKDVFYTPDVLNKNDLSPLPDGNNDYETSLVENEEKGESGGCVFSLYPSNLSLLLLAVMLWIFIFKNFIEHKNKRLSRKKES